jgi:hypothetical protein
LETNVQLPEKTLVYVIVPALEVSKTSRIRSPRLANPSQFALFEKEVVEEVPNAGV